MNLRKEYPRPQFVRESYINLNGEWDFEFDFGNSGKARGMYKTDAEYSKKIIVPFCPESELSGIGYKDFMRSVWYRRKVDLQKGEGRTLLHFEAVDYEAYVWVNEKPFPVHTGGYTGFTLDITDAVIDGENTIVLNAVDLMIAGVQPRGKQSEEFYSHGCDYTRTTGIWQTVWIEQVPQSYIKSSKIKTASLSGVINCDIAIEGCLDDLSLKLTAYYEGRVMGSEVKKVSSNTVNMTLCLQEAHLWEVGAGRLYDIKYELLSGYSTVDFATGYFGLRTVSLNNGCLCINNNKVFQRLVLDQGFYPDGIYTAPSDDALIHDIELSLVAGFNGARLHQKVFEQRFLYHADIMGYIVWGEFASWGVDTSSLNSLATIIPQWLEEIDRDFSHPSIIGWCPLNETWDWGGRQQDNRFVGSVYRITKAADNTRPCIDTSGNFHVETDIFDIHDYNQDAASFKKNLEENRYFVTFPQRQSYNGQPYFVSEYGGTRWAPDIKDGWGYGGMCKTEDEAVDRNCGVTKALLDLDYCCGFCYTQLTDVEQEQNGIYTYGRGKKFSDENYKRIYEAFSSNAAIEEI